MKVQGLKTEAVTVEVRPIEVLDALRDEWIKSMPGDYIKDGRWYRDGYPPGYRIEVVGLEATELQKQVWDSFVTIMQLASEYS